MRPATPARKTLAATALFKSAGSAIHLRLWAGDEGGQAIDAAGIGNHRLGLGLRLILRLGAMLAFAVMLARLLVALVGLTIAALFTRIVVADVRLLLLRDEARLLAEMRKTLALVVAVFRCRLGFVVGARLRLVLPELRDRPAWSLPRYGRLRTAATARRRHAPMLSPSAGTSHCRPAA